MRFGIDLTGGDEPAPLFFHAIAQAYESFLPACSFHVFATQTIAEQFSVFIKENIAPISPNILFHIVDETIAMADDPLKAIRRKKNSSLVIGMRMLKKKRLDAFISCGNTGALIASAALSMPMLPGIARPALLATLPTARGPLAVLDIGGTVLCRARDLIQFAFLGAAYQRVMNGIECPTVGLLNVGIESKKGTAEIRHAYELLKNHCADLPSKKELPQMHFVGNVEGGDIFNGVVDVLVTDGFTGNVLLKTAEGIASFIFSKLSEIATAHRQDTFFQTFQQLQKQFNHNEYPGAIVCGIEGIVIKTHGSASPKALYNSIAGAAKCIQKRIISLTKTELELYRFNAEKTP